MADEQLGALLRRLTLPIYLPAALYASGAAAIIPVIPLVGLQLGLDVPQVALLVTAAGLVAVAGPLPVGQVAARVGERTTLLLGGLVSIVAVTGCLVAALAGTRGPAPGWAAPLFCAGILVMTLGDLTWDLGRQTYLADEIPVQFRARAMTLFGGTMRVGRIIGPLVGAGVILMWGVASAFAVHLVAALVALGLMLRFIPPRVPVVHTRDAAGPGPQPGRPDVLRPLLLVGGAVLVLTVARTNRDLLLPLIGQQFGHSEAVISLVFAAAAVVELAFILPAGSLMDHFGRAAVLVPCLALMGVGFWMAPLATSVAGFVGVSMVFAVGNGLGAGINKTLSADMTPVRNRAGWLGLWNSYTGSGALFGPGLVALATGVGGVVGASIVTGWATAAGTAWAMVWLPRLTPARRKRADGPS